MKTRASGTAPDPYLENCAGGIDALRTRHAQLAAARFESLRIPVERRGARDRTSPTPSACIVSRNSSPGRRSTRSLISATSLRIAKGYLPSPSDQAHHRGSVINPWARVLDEHSTERHDARIVQASTVIPDTRARLRSHPSIAR